MDGEGDYMRRRRRRAKRRRGEGKHTLVCRSFVWYAKSCDLFFLSIICFVNSDGLNSEGKGNQKHAPILTPFRSAATSWSMRVIQYRAARIPE